jgi:hypothetical protein
MHIPHTHTELPSMHVIQYLGEEMIALAQGRALRTMLLRLSLSVVFAAMKATSSRRSRETFHCSRLAFRLVLAIKSLP